ncbi:MAG: mediator of RNA polymerase II transcription subunit 16 [Candidatus Muirbacterium halophilum]|nr:mediator of RNA polymerase II transcription subunit 16 [Candidatus Muirbacterium halophilum]MCK9475176.1 mediator of RNA polymerase II transcription subunit 16 [Candidatus Muirbacterium halophilum]
MLKNTRFYAGLLLFIIFFLFTACSGKPSKTAYITPISLNKAPVIENIRIQGNKGNIQVYFDIWDEEADTASVDIYYSVDSGEVFRKTANVTGNSNIGEGTNKLVNWFSASDITNEVDVILKLVSNDFEKTGNPVYSQPFHINNYGEVFFKELKLSSSKLKIAVDSSLFFSNLKVYAVYSDNAEILVGNVNWSLKSGIGNLFADRFNAPSQAQTVILECSYTASGITQKTELEIEVFHTLTDIVLEPTQAQEVGGYYDLSLVKLTAHYNDGQTAVVFPNLWYVKSGSGQVQNFNGGFVFFADQTANQGAVLSVRYSENSITIERDFPVTITGDDVELAFIRNVTGNSTDIMIEYTLVNPNSNINSIEFYYSKDGGNTYSKSLNISGLTENLPEGDHIITWHSDMDISGYENNVRIKIVPVINNLKKDHIPSGMFTVDNTPRTLDRIELSTQSVNASLGIEKDLNNIQIIAYYSDAPYRIIANVNWRKKSGVGSISQNGKFLSTQIGHSVVEAYYMEGGIGKAKDVFINVGRKLTKLTTSHNSEFINVSTSYDLRQVKVFAHYAEEGIQEEITNPVWNILEGNAGLSGYIVTGTMSGTVVFQTSFQEGDIIQTASFVLKVIPIFQSFELIPSSFTMNKTDTLDLDNIIKKIHYNDGSTKTITNVDWIIKSGPGTISSDNVFTSQITSSNTVLTVSFEEGVYEYTKDFNIIINPVSISVRIDSGPLNLHANQVFDLTNLDIIARYDNNSEKIVTNITWKLTGQGTITGNTYKASAISGSAFLEVSYQDPVTNQIWKDGILITILPALDHLSSNIMSYNLDIGNTKNLTDFVVTAHYDDGSSRVVTNLSYQIFSGDGILIDSVFTAPINAGNTVLRISHNHGGNIKNVDITFIITPLLKEITLSPNNANLGIGGTLNLNNIIVTASYDGRNSKTVSNVTWIIISGGGTLNGSTYTGVNSGVNRLECRYSETTSSGLIIEKTAVLEIFVDSILTAITINPSGINLAADNIFNLRAINVVSHYSDGSVQNISYEPDLIWSIAEGSGTLIGNDFQAPSASGITKLKLMYKTQQTFLNITTQHRLESIQLSFIKKVIKVSDLFDIGNNLDIKAHYNDGYIKDLNISDVDIEITNNIGTWQSVGIYLAPGGVASYEPSESAILKFSYTENNIEKNTNFEIIIKPELTSLEATPQTIRIRPGNDYQLENLKITGVYNNQAEVKVPFNKIMWSKISGNGEIAHDSFGKSFYDNNSTHKDIALIRADYTENGISENISITINTNPDLISLTLNPSTTNLNSGNIYNLTTNLTVNSNYDNAVTETRNSTELTYTIINGSGSINQIAGEFIYDSTGTLSGDIIDIEVSYEENEITVVSMLTIHIQ